VEDVVEVSSEQQTKRLVVGQLTTAFNVDHHQFLERSTTGLLHRCS